MNEIFGLGIAAATRLTQAGKLAEATALLQRLLRGETAQPNSDAVSRLAVEAPLIEGSVVAPPHSPDLGSLFDRFAPAGKPIALRTRRNRSPAIPADVGNTPGGFVASSFSNSAGTRAYKLYTPILRDGGARPLIVMLHGCTQSPDDFATGTRMNVCAEERECFVLYPEQATSANPSKCWNWFKSSDQVRGRGEPSIIAGLTRYIMSTYAIDPSRVYIAGLSAGGAAAAVMGEAYPDLYAAVGVHSGLACGAARDMPSAFMAMSGQVAMSQVRPRSSSSFVPTIVFHGDSDSTVHPRNGAEVVARAAELSDLQTMTENGTALGRSYTRSIHCDNDGHSVMEEWIIHGAGHAWSGGSAHGSFADAKGPDASREMLRFFLSQRR
jgi:poly(hydroxyalkanoate) depolymerase family esterase